MAVNATLQKSFYWKAKSLQLVGFSMADLEVLSCQFLGLQSIKAVKVENVSSFYMKHRSVQYFQAWFHGKCCFVKENRKLYSKLWLWNSVLSKDTKYWSKLASWIDQSTNGMHQFCGTEKAAPVTKLGILLEQDQFDQKKFLEQQNLKKFHLCTGGSEQSVLSDRKS